MDALKEELQHFELSVGDPQLQSLIPLQQRFFSTTASMESLIKENNTVIESLKRMHRLFRNFCRLNSKVYARICEHEVNMYTQLQRTQAVASASERRLQCSLGNIKSLQEGVSSQLLQSRNEVQESLQGLHAQLSLKVDQQHLNQQLNAILGQQLPSPTQILQSNSPTDFGRNQETNLQIISLKQNKTSKFASYQQFIAYKLLNDKQFQQSKNEIQLMRSDLSTLRIQLNQTKIQINKLKQQQQDNKQMNIKLEDNLNNQLKQLTLKLKQLQKQMLEKTHPDLLFTALSPFKMEIITMLQNITENNTVQILSQFTAIKQESSLKTNQLFQQIQKNNKSFSVVSDEFNNFKSCFADVRMKIKSIELQIKKELSENKKENQINDNQLKVIINQQLEVLKQGQNQLSLDLNSKVNCFMTSFQQRMMDKSSEQINSIKREQSTNQKSIKQLRQCDQDFKMQLESIVHILSNKANFSDLVYQLERKVDKEEGSSLKRVMKKKQINIEQEMEGLAKEVKISKEIVEESQSNINRTIKTQQRQSNKNSSKMSRKKGVSTFLLQKRSISARKECRQSRCSWLQLANESIEMVRGRQGVTGSAKRLEKQSWESRVVGLQSNTCDTIEKGAKIGFIIRSQKRELE